MQLASLIVCLMALCAVSVALWDAIRKKRQACAREQKLEGAQEQLAGVIRETATDSTQLGDKFCAFCLEYISGIGGLIYIQQEKSEASTQLRVLARQGVCLDWFHDSSEVVDIQRDTGMSEHVSYDFFWSRRALIYDQGTIKKWLPPQYSEQAATALIAPLRTDAGDGYVAIFRNRQSPAFTPREQALLTRYVVYAELSFDRVRVERERRELESALHRAHEEGMLQISTGIIHNIGNAVTVLQLAVERLRTDEFSSCSELVSFLRQDIFPDLNTHMEDGSIGDFFLHDPTGQEYVRAIQDVINRIAESIDEHEENLAFISEKFHAITEIITLQQRFIGELGTENVIPLNGVIRDVEKLFLELFSQRNITFRKKIDISGKVLVDPAMLRHILFLLIKYSSDSVTASQKATPMIQLRTSKREQEDKTYLRLELEDNGVGEEVHFQAYTDGADHLDLDERTRDFIFCKRRVEKYGGTFRVLSDYARGTRIILEFPEYTDSLPNESPNSAPAGNPVERKETE